MSDERRAGERWVEIAFAAYLREEATTKNEDVAHLLRGLAQSLEDRSWRRPEFQSVVDPGER